jgi:hypothetical protein
VKVLILVRESVAVPQGFHWREKNPTAGFSLDLASICAHTMRRVHFMHQFLSLSSPVIKGRDLTSRFPL